MDEDKDSEDEGSVYSANVSMLLPVSQLKELLPPVKKDCKKAVTYPTYKSSESICEGGHFPPPKNIISSVYGQNRFQAVR